MEVDIAAVEKLVLLWEPITSPTAAEKSVPDDFVSDYDHTLASMKKVNGKEASEVIDGSVAEEATRGI
ncbi:hypothetical protein M6B38_280945 [Iris pallida]|uniref:Uncharacterized protein n=1 Tax=Iris pallida TaxID=29817 RepID=A0AAX6I051_IRIPA|nr:hypothetical protein M6B38_280945 [Iris pallida]